MTRLGQVWLCQDGHACANGTSSFFCFVYDEVRDLRYLHESTIEAHHLSDRGSHVPPSVNTPVGLSSTPLCSHSTPGWIVQRSHPGTCLI
jgi:hypothetical protein